MYYNKICSKIVDVASAFMEVNWQADNEKRPAGKRLQMLKEK